MISAKELRAKQLSMSPARPVALRLIEEHIAPLVLAESEADTEAWAARLTLIGAPDIHYEIKRILESEELGYHVQLTIKNTSRASITNGVFFISWR
jgi:hypothetical protein